LPQPKILVIGDFMTDVYHIGTASRLSPEAPIPVVNIEQELVFDGGAGNVTMNLAALGADVITFPRGVRPEKHRLIVGDTQLARWDVNDRCERLIAFPPNSKQFTALVIADYNKGSIGEDALQYIRDFQGGVYIDTKDPLKYVFMNPYATFFPNYAEWEAHYDFYRNTPRVVVKWGADGMRYYNRGDLLYTSLGHNVPVRSVNGAGDTAMAAFVYAIEVLNYTFNNSLRFANAAAAIAVTKPYTSTVTRNEIASFLKGRNNRVESLVG
jgi:bifunctional ADP-heptose synthase (sugar kinase/adenylyltransferase)